MKYDVWRFCGGVFLSGLIGVVSGHFWFCLAFGLIVFILWQCREFSKILTWLKSGNEISSPYQPGLVDDICREISHLRDRNKLRKLKLSGYLRRFQDATSALPDAVIVLGEHGEIEWANKKAMHYIGVQWPRDAGLRISNLVRFPKLINYLSSNKTRLERGLQIPSPTDSKLQLEVRISPYGETQKLLVARDVTDVAMINQMRKDFIANASHELRTPLTVISGYLEGFSDDAECPDVWRSYINQMCIQATRMQCLIQDLTRLSTLEGNINNQKERQIVRVPDMLRSIVIEAESLSGLMCHEIKLNTQPNLMLHADYQEIYSVFSNLVFNAVRHTPEQGLIQVEWFEDESAIRFIVRDNGPGIEARHISRLTERFYRADNDRSREKGGTGLGLAIVKHGVARYQGKLLVESKLNEGSVFSCEFPKSLKIIENIKENQNASA